MPIWLLRPKERALTRPDEGIQHTRREYLNFLKAHELKASATPGKNCHDNEGSELFTSLLDLGRIKRNFETLSTV